jgi:adenine-specific DNA-methyltransferase
MEMGRQLGVRVSGLAGLHAHFFLATALYAQPGDIGCFVTSAEWLDVNYGSVIRSLLGGQLRGQALHVADPRAVPFEDAMTTAAISCFQVGAESTGLRLGTVESAGQLRDLSAGRWVDYQTLAQSARWTPFVRGCDERPEGDGLVPLHSLAEVHRGSATGSNEFFVLTRERARFLGIEEWCRPAITSAKEILESGGVVRDGPERRVILDIPRSIDRAEHPRLDGYLRMGEQRGPGGKAISERYIPTHRRPWWHLGLSAPPPIVATYMARQAPVFAGNPDGLALINIAHGVYPRRRLETYELAELVHSLNASRQSFQGGGRTYHGGLEKFEPREMEALLVPALGSLLA